MRRLMLAAAASLLLAACAPATEDQTQAGDESQADEVRAAGFTDEGPEHHLIYTPDDIEWQDAPPSLEPGAQTALLEGDPGEQALFTMRIRMPDGFRISPHHHPGVERVTVISGTFLLGSGEEIDPDDTVRLEAGSYTSIPPGTPHFAIAEGETVIQLTSIGPWDLQYVSADDDPRDR